MSRSSPFGWLRWHRYRAVIVGTESGNRSPLDFVRFRTELRAIKWCAAMSASEHKMDNPLTRWDYEEIP